MDKEKLPLRIGVGIIVLNHENKIFVGKRKDNPVDKWQMPQGGVDKGEDFITAMKRELWEETGLKIVDSYQWNNLRIPGWEAFYKNNIAPDGSKLNFFFRAITPIGRPRRFDARFFICFAQDLSCNLDDFSNASSELRHLQWIELEKTQDFDLPIITRIVLKEVQDIILNGANKKGIPFYDEGSSSSNFTYL